MESEKIDPMLRPLTANYNDLVDRLAELEEENASRRESLEQQVRSVTQALLQQQRSLAVAQRLAAVGEVAAQIAHELRNPLAGIQVALTNMKQEWKERPEISDRLELIVDELRRVTGLLNGLLDQSRHAPEPVERVSLSKELSGPLALARYQLSEHIHLINEIPEDLVCLLPKQALRQAVLNLVLNAAQAIGDQAGTVTVQAFREDGQMVVAVSDDGPGIPQGEVARIGERFFRGGDVHTRSTRGTGLGLAVVSEILELHGSRLDVESRVGEGSRFSFRLAKDPRVAASTPLPQRHLDLPRADEPTEAARPATPMLGLRGERFETVMTAATTGVEWAIGLLYREFHPAVLRYLRARGARAPDAAAEQVWMEVARGLQRFSGDEVAFRRWLFELARRPLEEGDRIEDPIEVEGVAREAMSDALAKVAALPADHADVLLLRALGHLDVDDVASITGQDTGAVRLLEMDALRLLRDADEVETAEVRR
jgi:signal transduction histidine kinase/DNA-directed RNA polymerase specialized sigma24 family protein